MSNSAWYQVRVDMATLAPAGKLRENIGIETLGGVFTPLIRKGSGVPATWSHLLSTGEDNQSAITLRLFRGNKKQVTEAVALGRFAVSGIAPAAKGTPKILVELKVDGSGIWLHAQDQLGSADLVVVEVAS